MSYSNILNSICLALISSALFICCGNDPYCQKGLSWCWAQCVDFSNDNDNCGSCDNACKSDQTCIEGICSCQDGYAFCNGICANTTSDVSNCGGCGNSCKDYETCYQGFCMIIDEFDSDGDGYAGEDWGGDDCDDSDPQIHPTANDICDGRDNDCDGEIDENSVCQLGDIRECSDNVGECRYGTQECQEGCLWGDCVGGVLPTEDVCDGLDNDCDGDTDEDFDLSSDPENCGLCGVICQRDNATAKCEAGICSIERCDTLWDDCNGVDQDGCETLLETLTNCGACGAICSGPGGCITCLGGICSSLDYADCDGDPVNGKETDVCSDEQNCGYCSNECSIGESCIDAVCQ